jgi:hypothetical protein
MCVKERERERARERERENTQNKNKATVVFSATLFLEQTLVPLPEGRIKDLRPYVGIEESPTICPVPPSSNRCRPL